MIYARAHELYTIARFRALLVDSVHELSNRPATALRSRRALLGPSTAIRSSTMIGLGILELYEEFSKLSSYFQHQYHARLEYYNRQQTDATLKSK